MDKVHRCFLSCLFGVVFFFSANVVCVGQSLDVKEYVSEFEKNGTSIFMPWETWKEVITTRLSGMERKKESSQAEWFVLILCLPTFGLGLWNQLEKNIASNWSVRTQ